MVAQLLTVKRVAGELGVSRSTVYKMLGDRVFPTAPIRLPGRDPRWSQEVVDEWVDTHRCGRRSLTAGAIAKARTGWDATTLEWLIAKGLSRYLRHRQRGAQRHWPRPSRR